jgi:hypothetical protein
MDKTLTTLLDELTDLNDISVCGALADRLYELGDERAVDVEDLARVVPVIPALGAAPKWVRLEYDKGVEYEVACDPRDPGAIARDRPLACGAWWSIAWHPSGVTCQVYPGTVQAERINRVRQNDYYPLTLTVQLPMLAATPEVLRRAFEVLRREVLAAALGVWLRYAEAAGALARQDPGPVGDGEAA